MANLKLLYKVFGPYKWQMGILAAFGFLSGIFAGFGVSMVIPLLSIVLEGPHKQTGAMIQYIVKAFDFLRIPYSIPALLTLMVLLFAIRAALLFIFSYTRARIEYSYRMDAIEDFFSNILYAQWPYLLKQKAGHIYTALINDIEKGAALHGAIAHLILSFLSMMVFLAFAVAISPRMTLLTLIGGVVLIAIMKPLLWRARRAGTEFAKESRSVSQYLTEHISGLKTIKASSSEAKVFKRGMEIFERWRRAELKAAVLGFLNRGSLEPLSIIFIAYIFIFSYKSPGFSIQVFAATIFFIQRTFVYMEGIQTSLHTINATIPHVVELDNFREELLGSKELDSGKQPFQFRNSLAFRDVHFSYMPGTPVLSGVNFSLKKGEMVGLIGTSGAGKTSVADIALRFFLPQKGAVTLDGTDISELSLGEWRAQVGYVSQDIFLLNDTIENNIKFYNKELSDAGMVAAARQANIYEFISGLKDGFSTVIGDRGIMLSGGQRQRIVLARALSRKPAILILDEATSSLDNESEALIQKSIQDLRGKVTILVIAHRLSTVLDVDRLMVLDRGVIVEEGRPRELLARPDSYFYRMYHVKEV